MSKVTLIFISIFLGTLIFLAQCKNAPICSDDISNGPSWRGIIPGRTTLDEVNDILGLPYDSGTSKSSREVLVAVYESEDNVKSRPHRIFFDKDGCVLLISEYRGKAAPNLWDLVQSYGEPEAIKTGGAEVRSTQVFIYAEKGIAISGDFTQDPESAYLFRVMYFVPTSTEMFLDEWHDRLLLGGDFSPHPDWKVHFED